MTHVALTCPRLLFTIGLTIDARPGRRDAMPPLIAALHDLGGPVRRGVGVGWFAVELADSVDAVLALQALGRALPDYDIEVSSIVGSAAAAALLADPTAAHAWDPLRAQIHCDEPPADFARGIAALRHYRELNAWPVPDAISEQRVPAGPLVLWHVGVGLVVVAHEPFVIGRDPMCDLQLATMTASRRHAGIARSTEGWMIRDLDSASGIMIDGRRPRSQAELRPGMVVQFAKPHAFVVLAIGPDEARSSV